MASMHAVNSTQASAIDPIDLGTGTDEEPGLGGPVVVLTEEVLATMRENERLNPPPIVGKIVVSPLGDESVQGYRGDKWPLSGGAQEIKKAVRILEESNITFCMVAEPALIYYGTGRVMHDWILCVPTDQLDGAANLFRERPDRFEPFRPSALKRPDGLEDFYPRFKFVGLRLFFIIMSSQACHIPCQPENIEYSQTGIPYPKLPVYAQSLLDSSNFVDLDDLIDGMNLSIEWGEENLDLDGTIDADWGRWKADILHGGKATTGQIPRWCLNPEKRRELWTEMASADARKHRQGFKYNPSYETRFWRRGQRDPRLRKRNYC